MPRAKNKVRCFAYLRVSSQKQTEGHGYDRQLKTIAIYAKRNGYDVVGVYRDAHTGTEADRPGFQDMVANLNGITTVLIESLDRFARDLAVQIALLAALDTRGITLISASTGQDVTADVRNDPMRECMVMVQGIFAQTEKKLLVRKLRVAREAKRKEAGRCEGRKPFGSLDGEVDTLRRMRELRRKPRGAKRLSFAAIARALESEGHPTRNGGQWNRGCIAAILNR